MVEPTPAVEHVSVEGKGHTTDPERDNGNGAANIASARKAFARIGGDASRREDHHRRKSVARDALSHPHMPLHVDGEAYLSLFEAEKAARSRVVTNPLKLFLINGYSAFAVFGKYLISLESVFGCLLTVSATLVTYFNTKSNPDWNGSIDFVLLSFAVITPMSVSIGMTFQRREKALKDLAIVRSCSYQIYLAHVCWDWGKGGRAASAEAIGEGGDFWLRHSDKALTELIEIGDELFHFLTLPSASRARHRITKRGKKESAMTMVVAHRLFDSLLTTRMAKLTSLTEDLKRAGLPANEASRIRQFERFVGEAIEELRMIKLYRTPQALRSFARLFTVFLPPFYGI